MDIPAWFQATRTGEFTVGCAELCGLQHYRMKGTLTVLSAEEFGAWSAQQVAAAPATPAPSPGMALNAAAGSPRVAAAGHAH
jgi:cytochrome c oxidase subunit 2